jgi:hypothetical protein
VEMAGEIKQICYTWRFGAVPKWPKGEVCKSPLKASRYVVSIVYERKNRGK